nr:uncharacterized protein LOC108060377 [Drosophila takahashii]
MSATLRILVLQVIISWAGATEYQLILDEDGHLAPCEHHPGNPSNFDAMVDMTTVNVTNSGNKMAVEGQQSVIWKDVQPGDNIKISVQILRMEKGSWQKTMFGTSSNNFCKNMFDKNQMWYQFWTKYITNSDEIKSKCLNTPGAVIKYQPYEIELRANLNVPNLDGRYKVVLLIEAFDKRNVKRPVSICTEFRGNALKV